MTDTEKLAESGKVVSSVEVTPGPGAVNWAQIGRGLLYAVVSTVFPILISSFNKGSFTVDWKSVGTVALSTALGYILTKFVSPTQQITTFKKP